MIECFASLASFEGWALIVIIMLSIRSLGGIRRSSQCFDQIFTMFLSEKGAMDNDWGSANKGDSGMGKLRTGDSVRP